MTVDPRVAMVVEAQLGVLYRELLGVMLDLDVPPTFLFMDERERLVDVRDRAASVLADWAANDPEAVAEITALVPEVLRAGRCEVSLLEGGTWDAYFGLPASMFEMPTAGAPAFRAVPELVARLDGDGLVDIAGLDARPHGLLAGGYSLQYHQLLRRGFRSNVHYPLVAELLGAQARHGCRTRLAIDERRVRLESEHSEVFEYDYWHGAPLSTDDLDDLHAVGETVHGDPEGGRSLLNPYVGLTVRWTVNGALKVVQIEEQVPADSGEGHWVFARYLHAIRDTDARTFVHCDGAVKAYERSEYPDTPAKFKERGKGARYRKVFRLDGDIPTELWSGVAAHWFRGNSLILEYLSSGG